MPILLEFGANPDMGDIDRETAADKLAQNREKTLTNTIKGSIYERLREFSGETKLPYTLMFCLP